MTVGFDRWVLGKYGQAAHLVRAGTLERVTLCGRAVTGDASPLTDTDIGHFECYTCRRAAEKLTVAAATMDESVGPVWKATWGTCAALVVAATAEDARAIVIARDRVESPGRVPLDVMVRPATAADIEAAAEAGKWSPPSEPVVNVDEPALFPTEGA